MGVPQGSSIGRLMFIIYINDLPSVLEHFNCLMYADDTVVYGGDYCSKMVRKNVQKDLNYIEKWFLENSLSLNVQKTKLIVSMSDHKRKTAAPFHLYMKGKLIDEVDKYKYLGTTIDNRLSGDPQFTKLTQCLGMRLRTFNRVRKYLTTSAALTVYESTILPLIEYNDMFQELWSAEKLGVSE